MPLFLLRGDITRLSVDAIVNAANRSLLGGGGVDGAIHAAAGPDLLNECRSLGGCKTGNAKVTGAYNLPCRFVIHTVGPVWQGGNRNEPRFLAAAYSTSLTLSRICGCRTVAFPLISAGAYGYPRAEALRVATQTIRAFLQEHEITVYLVLYDRRVLSPFDPRFAPIAARLSSADNPPIDAAPKLHRARALCKHATVPADLTEAVNAVDEGFSQTLLHLIDQKGLSDSACYKRANVDRRLFSKIRSDAQYRPSKATVLAFAVALELSLPQTEALLRKAGFAFTNSRKADVIVSYYIEHGIYDIGEINEALFTFGQALLGS